MRISRFFALKIKIDYIHLLYIKTSIVDVISQILKKPVNKLIIGLRRCPSNGLRRCLP